MFGLLKVLFPSERKESETHSVKTDKSETRRKFEASLHSFSLLTKILRSETEKNDEKIEEIAADLRQYNTGADAIIDKNRSVANISKKMRGDIEDMSVLLDNNIRQTLIIKNQHDAVIAGIMRLGGQVTKIKDFVRAINAITDQTKVIAFNAALEAASAGENGKRFSVVSSEINRLADDVAKITKLIKDQIEDIFGASSALIVSSEAGSEQIVVGKKFMSELAESFKTVESGSELVTQESEKTLSMGEKQAQIADSLRERVKGLTKVSALNASAHLDRAADDLARFVAELANEPK